MSDTFETRVLALLEQQNATLESIRREAHESRFVRIKVTTVGVPCGPMGSVQTVPRSIGEGLVFHARAIFAGEGE